MLPKQTIQNLILTFAQKVSEIYQIPRVKVIDAIANDQEVIGIFITFSMAHTRVFLKLDKLNNTLKEIFPDAIKFKDYKKVIKEEQYFSEGQTFETVFTIWQTTFHITTK